MPWSELESHPPSDKIEGPGQIFRAGWGWVYMHMIVMTVGSDDCGEYTVFVKTVGIS